MSHTKFLTRCLQLANYAKGRTLPNPLVGAVIVHNGKIIGEGYHHKAGEPHAEVMAINSVKNTSLLASSTLYCSLEPCAHYGKTPPCSLLITDRRIPKVVIGCSDSNALVNGKGVEHLKSHGVEVLFAEDPAPFRQLNQVFFCNKEHKRPFVTLKWAQSLDGYLDRIRTKNEQASLISGPLAAIKSHQLRSEVDGILISAKTLNWDRPSLSTRHYHGTNPRPILLVDNTLPDSLALENFLIAPLLIGNVSALEGDKIICDPYDIAHWLPELLNHDIHHVLVEGGGQVLQSFLDAGMVDQWHRFTSEKRINDGISAPKFPETGSADKLGTDRYERG
jgi:diaminohydroxyphosphoribosylaminopyrimidine deaminase / 5-amino-6-(5-phosphoribosylamino)uracil reductase